ncbi:glycoside hydrolase family 73 protein [Brochothrix thermosphacta]|uniref:glycoside hydrolase family 73 protein n=1 Tax=Brochothrix thermosphacta TaxID=2756 RepID=UPI003F96C76E
MKKNKMLLVLMSGVLTFTAMPSVYASNSSEILTSEKSNSDYQTDDKSSEKKLESTGSLPSSQQTEETSTNSISSEDSTTLNSETINSESGTETTEEIGSDAKESVEESTPEEKAVEETLANLPKMELRPELGPGYYQVEVRSNQRSKRSIVANTAMSSSEEFLSKIKAGAISGWKKYKVLPSLTGAQAVLESGWGSSGLSQSANNLFGIKGRYNGQFELWPTLEYINGEWVTVNAEFRKYPSWKESMEDHGKFLVENPRYYKVLGEKDYIKATTEIWRAGYATDPDYPGKLQRTITYNNLTLWDAEAFDDNVDLTKYYTANPGTIVMKKNDNQFSSVEFSDKTKGTLQKKGTVLKVSGITYSSKGIPRLKLTNGNYLSASKSIVLKTVATAENYYTLNPGTIVMKKDDNQFSSVEFSDKTRGTLQKKGSVLKVTDVVYSSNGTPRLKLANGNYLSASKSIVQKTVATATNYYTLNPGTIVMKKDDNQFSSVEFSDKTRGTLQKKGNVLKVTDVVYSSNGTPRLKLTNGNYISASKSIVQKTIDTAANYYTLNPGTIVMKKDDNQFSSTEFSSSTQGALQKKNSVLKVSDIVYSSKGIPRLKLTNGNYISANKGIVQQTIVTINNYYRVNPETIVMKVDDNQFSSPEFSNSTRGKMQKKGTVLKVSSVVFSSAGIPRLKLTNGNYISANKKIVQQTIDTATNYYTLNPKTIVMKVDDNQFSSPEFSNSTRGKMQKKGTVLKVSSVVFSSAGIPRLKLTNGNYISANKKIVQQTIDTATNYYTLNPKTIVMKVDDNQFSSPEFSNSTRGKMHKKSSVLKVSDVVYSNTGIPRLKLTNGNFISANKGIVLKTTPSIDAYYTTLPAIIVMKADDHSYSSVDFSSNTRGKLRTKGTVLYVKEIMYTSGGTPRLKLSDNSFVTGKKTIVQHTISTVNNYYTKAPKEVIMKVDDNKFTSTEFNNETRSTLQKKGKVLKVKDVSYSSTGIPRLKIDNGFYISANKKIIEKK